MNSVTRVWRFETICWYAPISEPAGDISEPVGDISEPAGDISEPAGDLGPRIVPNS